LSEGEFMSFSLWKVPIVADSYRSTELDRATLDRNGLVLSLIEEDSESRWNLTFDSIQACRMTTEECSSSLIESLPEMGGFFRTDQSMWLSSLGKGDISFLDCSSHFVVCCYDEVIEVIANRESFSFEKRSG